MAHDQPGFERRRRARRVADIPAAAAPDQRRSDHGPRGRKAAVACALAVLALAVVGFVLAHWAVAAGDSITPGRVYAAFGIFVAWVALLACALIAWIEGPRGALARMRRPMIVRQVRNGIENGEFELHFQPQVEIASGKPFAVEALLRWRRRDGLQAPGEFLPDVEATEAMGPLTDHVLDLALAQAGRWHAAGKPIGISVNLSAANLRDAELPGRLAELMAGHDVTPSTVTVEVTETAVLGEPEQTRAVLDEIAQLGVSISVDDFGTGYSSLLWLRLFPVTEVKVDRTFVSEVHNDGEAYVSGVVRLAHDLGLSVVAEGIEDEATLQTLERLGCDIGQGYLFSRPVPAPVLEQWFEEHLDARWAPRRRELHLPADFDSLDQARELVEAAATELGYADDEVWDMKLAVTEAVANAIEHGSGPAGGLIHLRLSHEAGELRIDVSGGGGGAQRPAGAEEVHRGRGFAIMTALMDEVGMRREADDTLIRLAKRTAAR
jgi:EAL domain-containing protein (putative c-di-GMP-specific phosphodiesterase class I)/anti-sigma regulatory factor (Ser/Thr protein kinase)